MEIILRNHNSRCLKKGQFRSSSIYLFLFLIIFVFNFSAGCIENEISKNVSGFPEEKQNNSGITIDENIEKTLVGHQIVYYDIAGEPRYYNISKKDIRSIEKSESEGEVVWVVTVGSGMQWEMHLNSTGESILEENQLFRT